MRAITWSPRAARDLQDMYDFYTALNENAAQRLYDEIIREAEILASFPYLGPREPLFAGRRFDYRTLTTRRGLHKIIYFVEPENIHIARIWDCRKNPVELGL